METMNHERITGRLLVCESLGFGLTITVSWLDESIGLPALLFGSSVQLNGHEAALEALVILRTGS